MGISNTSSIDYSKDLDVVHCTVDISLIGNNRLFDRLQLHKLFISEVTDIFNKYGVRYEIEPLQGLGGGGIGEGLISVLRSLWHQKMIHDFIISSVKLLFSRYVIGFIQKQFSKVDRTVPRMMIFLKITTDKELTKEYETYMDSAVIDRLLNLRRISSAIFNILSKNYPMFLFDQTIRASIYSKSFRVSYFVPHEMHQSFEGKGIEKTIKSMKIKEGTDSEYSLLNNFIVKKTERKTKFMMHGFVSEQKIKYRYYPAF